MNKASVGASIVAFAAFAGAAFAQDISTTNGYDVQLRVFNDFPATALTYGPAAGPAIPEPTPGVPSTNALAGFGGGLMFHEIFPAGISGNFADKHQGLFSADGGATALGVINTQSFSIDTDVMISAPASAGAPRKEAGIVFYNDRHGGWIDEGRVLVASENGEVAVYGAGMNFTGFGAGAYTLGTTAHIHFDYFAPGTLGATAEYRAIFTDSVTGTHDSGNVLFDPGSDPDHAANGFNSGSNIGFVDQNQRSPFVTDDITVVYSNPSVVPTPGSLALLGLAGLATARRRR